MQKLRSKREMLQYTGDLSQLFGIKEYRLIGGKGDGVRCCDIKNMHGVELTLAADRCMDIPGLFFKGINLGYTAKAGMVAPAYYNDRGTEFQRSFFAGFLTTCGLTYSGAPCRDGEEELGLHGRISNTPAEEFCAFTEWEDGHAVMKARGKMREARLFGENLVLTREITLRYDQNMIRINDRVENLGFEKQPLMLLYHINLGYPLLSEKSVMVCGNSKVRPRDSTAEKGVACWNTFEAPTPGYREQVFYHELKAGPDGHVFGGVINPTLSLGVIIHFNINQLKMLTQWKQMGQGDYVLGIEPCNSTVEGRAEAKRDKTLEYIGPGEVRDFELRIEILEGKAARDFLTANREG